MNGVCGALPPKCVNKNIYMFGVFDNCLIIIVVSLWYIIKYFLISERRKPFILELIVIAKIIISGFHLYRKKC